MESASIVESVEEDRQTELQRLGSSRLLVALTGADLAAETVLGRVAARARLAREVFESWAAAEEDERARAVFESAAFAQAEALDGIEAELDGAGDGKRPDDGDDPIGGVLAGFSGTVERAGGLVGWALVTDRVYAQVVGFFVNEAAAARTDLFRDLRKAVGAVREEAVDLLDSICESGTGRERAAGAADAVVRAAYEDYAETLEGMGLDPKPVC